MPSIRHVSAESFEIEREHGSRINHLNVCRTDICNINVTTHDRQ